MIKKLLFLLLLLMVTSIGKAQNTAATDTSVIFRFVHGRNMFYVPYKDNKEALTRILGIIDRYREDILSGKITLLVDGYCTDLRIAKTRSNRVKTEMILKGGLTEQCFTTANHREKGDYVKVTVPAIKSPLLIVEEVQETVADKHAEPEKDAVIDNEADSLSAITPEPSSARKGTCSHISLRANLLHWVTLTPDLGIEYRIHDTWGILINGTYTDLGWKNKSRRYKLWKVSPEFRYYIGKDKRGFLGAMYHIGEFNYKLGEKGKKGDYQGGGITGGYLLPLCKALSLDFHGSLGYTRAEYDNYLRIGEVNVLRGHKVKNHWGVNQLGVSLIWKMK